VRGPVVHSRGGWRHETGNENPRTVGKPAGAVGSTSATSSGKSRTVMYHHMDVLGGLVVGLVYKAFSRSPCPLISLKPDQRTSFGLLFMGFQSRGRRHWRNNRAHRVWGEDAASGIAAVRSSPRPARLNPPWRGWIANRPIAKGLAKPRQKIARVCHCQCRTYGRQLYYSSRHNNRQLHQLTEDRPKTIAPRVTCSPRG
jgi:hypothetical protein